MMRCWTNICLLPSKTCETLFKNWGKIQRFEGVGREQAMLLDHVYKENVNEEEKLKIRS